MTRAPSLNFCVVRGFEEGYRPSQAAFVPDPANSLQAGWPPASLQSLEGFWCILPEVILYPFGSLWGSSTLTGGRYGTLCQETLRHPARSGLSPGAPRSSARSGFLPKPGATETLFFQHSLILSNCFLLETVSWSKNYSELSSQHWRLSCTSVFKMSGSISGRTLGC